MSSTKVFGYKAEDQNATSASEIAARKVFLSSYGGHAREIIVARIIDVVNTATRIIVRIIDAGNSAARSIVADNGVLPVIVVNDIVARRCSVARLDGRALDSTVHPQYSIPPGNAPDIRTLKQYKLCILIYTPSYVFRIVKNE